MKIGFIGLGIMGKPMAKNLLKAGYTDLLVNNRSQAPIQELEAAGARGATQAEIGESCDVVITMLPNSPQVREVMLGDANNGVASHMKPGSVFIDCSSINPVASKEIAAALAGSLEAQFKLDPVRLSMDAASFPVAAKDMAALRGRKVGVPYLPTLPTPEGPARQGFLKTMTEAGLL